MIDPDSPRPVGEGPGVRGTEREYMSKQSQHDAAWQRVFEHTDLLRQIQEQGFAYISAKQLKTFGRREPRLMAKQDTLSARPAIFREHDLSIFPVENGQYVIFHDPEQKSYFRFDASLDRLPQQQYTSKIDLYSFETYPVNQRLSESQAIDFAVVSFLLQHFLEDEQLHLTIRGRLRSGSFHFTLPTRQQQIQVSGVQIEVDAGYESSDRIYLLEAKVGKREDFHIRQLMYPYLEWSQRSRKEVVPIFLIYSNGQYYLVQFRLSQVFGELTVVKKQCYIINESLRASINLLHLLEQVRAETEPQDIPYPQADDLDKVVDIIQLIEAGSTSKAEISDYFDFEERQGDYYLNAAAYLGFIKRTRQQFTLTTSGRHFCDIRSRSERTVLLITHLLQKPTFRAIFQRLSDQQQHLRLFENYWSVDELDQAEIASIIQTHTALNQQTASRRALTARSWVKWVLKNCDLFTS